jgi:hypothetical protein
VILQSFLSEQSSGEIKEEIVDYKATAPLRNDRGNDAKVVRPRIPRAERERTSQEFKPIHFQRQVMPAIAS